MKNQLASIVLVLFIFSGSNLTQTLNLQISPSNNNQFGLSFDKPIYSSEANYSALSGVYQFLMSIPVSSELNLVGNIPFVNTSYEYDFGFMNSEYSENGFGNIFVGFQTNPKILNNERSIITFGLFLPTAEEKSSFNGSTANYYDLQKYLPNSLGLYFNYAFQHTRGGGFNYSMEIGPNVIFPTQGKGRETEVFIHYGIDLAYQIQTLLLNAELLGIGILTEEYENFGDRFVHSLNFGAIWVGNNIKPKVYYKIYLKDQISESIDGVLGIGLFFII